MDQPVMLYDPDLERYRRTVAAREAALDLYCRAATEDEAAGSDFTPGCPHMEYHRAMREETIAFNQFVKRWGFQPTA